MITIYKIEKIEEKYNKNFFFKLQVFSYYLNKAQFKKWDKKTSYIYILI